VYRQLSQVEDNYAVSEYEIYPGLAEVSSAVAAVLASSSFTYKQQCSLHCTLYGNDQQTLNIHQTAITVNRTNKTNTEQNAKL